jgi:CheY-like chemotaxis protein
MTAMPARVLVVEDNPLIALDTQDHLQALGISGVDVAASNDEALALLAGGGHDFALLDYNLGSETSEPVANALERRGVPFAFATGYVEAEVTQRPYANKIAVLLKPYAKAELTALMHRLVPRLSPL